MRHDLKSQSNAVLFLESKNIKGQIVLLAFDIKISYGVEVDVMLNGISLVYIGVVDQLYLLHNYSLRYTVLTPWLTRSFASE